jgi:drug/metabolite transporter (DMT)-like permease
LKRELESVPPGAGGAKSVSAVLDWTLLLAPGLVWGASFLFIAESLEAIAPNGLTFVRLLIGFVTLSFVPGVRVPVAKGDWKGIFFLGLLWYAFPMFLFPIAQQHVASALAGMLNGVAPMMAVLAASITMRQWPLRGVVLGLVVGFAGAVMMGLPGIRAGGSEAGGVIMIIVAMSSYGVALNVARPLQQRNGALPIVWRALAVAVLLTAPFGIPDVPHSHWTLRSALSMLVLGVCGTALANIAMSVAAGRLGVARASATTFLIPVVSLILGVVVRNETVATLSLLGIVPCLAGAWIIRRVSMGRAT